MTDLVELFITDYYRFSQHHICIYGTKYNGIERLSLSALTVRGQVSAAYSMSVYVEGVFSPPARTS